MPFTEKVVLYLRCKVKPDLIQPFWHIIICVLFAGETLIADHAVPNV